MSHIVVVTYNWPPRNAIGTHRPYAWAKRWADKGHRVTVLTSRKQGFDAPLDLHLPLIPGVDVLEVDFKTVPGRNVSESSWLLAVAKVGKRFLRRRFGVVVDPRDGWARGAKDAARHCAESADFVVSTFGPRSAHLIAARMKRANPALCWVADYRDLWSQSHLAGYSPVARARERIVEQLSLDGADLVTTVSDELASYLRDLLGKTTHVVPNGFEEDAWVQDHVSTVASPLSIVYTGLLYPTTRDPTTLFAAIRGLLDEGAIESGGIRISFYGPTTDWLPKMVDRYSLGGVVEIHGRVDRDAALAAQRSADLLLLLESGLPEADGVLTGKVFEYIAAGRPILSFGSSARSAISRLLRGCGVGICLQDDVAAAKVELQRAASGKFPAWFTPDRAEISGYTRAGQADRLLELMVEANRESGVRVARGAADGTNG